MIQRVLVIGGYGNFGSFIARYLAHDPNIALIIAGRSLEKAQQMAASLSSIHPPQSCALDIQKADDLASRLSQYRPSLVIHTSGPFQSQNYSVARQCIEYGCHYIDLADAREFVSNIHILNAQAKHRNVSIISGASSVPALTSAVIDAYRHHFQKLEIIDYAIATAQKTNRGLATTQAILSYAGKGFDTIVNGKATRIYGWQGLRLHKFKEIGWRMLGFCNIPDLELFPKRYPSIRTIRFYAGIEVFFEHVGLWFLSWMVRLKLVSSLEKAAPVLLKISRLFDFLGSDTSAFYMHIRGMNTQDDKPLSITFNLTARDGHGPYIPCMPAILLAKRLAAQEEIPLGAYACMGIITLPDYLHALSEFHITWSTDLSHP